MTRALPRTAGPDSPASTKSITGLTAEPRPPFEHTHFSAVWNDAERSRMAFFRAQVGSLMRRIGLAVIDRSPAQGDPELVPGALRKAGAPNAP